MLYRYIFKLASFLLVKGKIRIHNSGIKSRSESKYFGSGTLLTAKNMSKICLNIQDRIRKRNFFKKFGSRLNSSDLQHWFAYFWMMEEIIFFRFYSTEARRGKAFHSATPQSPINSSIKVKLFRPSWETKVK